MTDENRALTTTSTSALSIKPSSDDVEIDKLERRVSFRLRPSGKEVAGAVIGPVIGATVAVSIGLVGMPVLAGVFAFTAAVSFAAQSVLWRRRRFFLEVLSDRPGKVRVRTRSGDTIAAISALTVQQGFLIETRKSLAVSLMPLSPPVAEAVRVWLNEHDPTLRKR